MEKYLLSFDKSSYSLLIVFGENMKILIKINENTHPNIIYQKAWFNERYELEFKSNFYGYEEIDDYQTLNEIKKLPKYEDYKDKIIKKIC